jgi:hypothetical protein
VTHLYNDDGQNRSKYLLIHKFPARLALIQQDQADPHPLLLLVFLAAIYQGLVALCRRQKGELAVVARLGRKTGGRGGVEERLGVRVFRPPLI